MAILSSLFNIGTDYPSAPPQGVAITQQKLAEEISPFYKDLLAKSQALFEDRTEEGFVPYTGPTMAPFTPQQEQAFTGIQSLVGTQAPQFQEATDLVRGTTQEFTPEVAQGLMSPFQQAVTDIEKREAQRDFEANVLPKVRQAQIAQGSFGGTRGSLLEAEALRNQQQQLADIQAKGSLQAYQDAQNLFKDQAAREAAAAGQLATFAPAQYKASVGELGALQSVGEEQQRQQQSALDEAYRQFLEEKRFPEDTLGRYQATVQGFPALRQEISKVTPPQPSMANQLIGGLGTIGSLYGAYGGFSPGGFGSALPGYGPIKRASGGLVSLQQGDSVERAMGEQEAVRNLRGINRGLELDQVRQQVPTMEREVREAFINEFYLRANEARESEQGKKDFLDRYGVGGTDRLTAEIILGIDALPNEAAPFRVDEAAIESGIPPAGMAQSYEELEDKFLQDESFPPLDRNTEQSGGLSGALQRIKEMTFGRAQGGPVIRAATGKALSSVTSPDFGRGGKDAVPPVLAKISGPMPFMTYFNQLSDQELIDLHNDLEKTGGRGANEAQYFLRENIKAYRPQIDVNELKTGFGDFVQSLYQRYVPRAENLAQTGEAIFTTPVDDEYLKNVKKKLPGSYQSFVEDKFPEIKSNLASLKTSFSKEDDADKKIKTETTQPIKNNELLTSLLNQDKALSGSASATQKAIKKLSDLNKKVTDTENEVIDRIKERDAKIAQKIQDSPEAVKTDLFALAAEKFTDLMRSTQKTVPAIAKGVGEFVKEGTGIGKEAQAGELDLENMAVDSMKDMATLRAGQFARGATEVAGIIDLANIEAKRGTLRRELLADGGKEFDKRFPRTSKIQGKDTSQAARSLFQKIFAYTNGDPDLATQAVNEMYPNLTP
jgi:hypothetical protein